MSEDKELSKDTSRKVEVEQSSREIVDTSNSGLYNKVTSSS